MFVLGIDPGSRFVGYGLVRIENRKNHAVDYGYFQVNTKVDFPNRLKEIYDFIITLIERCKPDVMAVEEVFVSQNAKTTLRLGHARGVILLAAVEKKIPVFEYAPREIKQAVVGRGGASKEQIQWMVRQIFNLKDDKIQADAADGLAVAFCHCIRSNI